MKLSHNKLGKLTDKHLGIAELKRNFADAVGEVVHGNKRIIVERRGRPVVAIVPLPEPADQRRPGQRLAAAVGSGGKAGEDFRRLMKQVVSKRRQPSARWP